MQKASSFNYRISKDTRNRWRTGTDSVLTAIVAIGLVMGAAAAGARSSTEAGQAEQAEFILDSMDKFRLKVFEWRPALDEIYEWKAINGDYTVGPAGNASIPLIGDVEARGNTPTVLGQRIGEQLKERFGLIKVPEVSIEIIKFRPFYILGEVAKPGEFAFRPGLTVLQALSIAGGFARPEDRVMRLGRELISGEGDIGLIQQQYYTLLARRARVEADLADTMDIQFPSELNRREPEIKRLMLQELEILKLERADLDARVANLDARKTSLEQEITLLEAQLTNLNSEKQLAHEELTKVKSLLSRQLTVEPRRLAAQRNVYQLEGDRLRLEAALHRMRQDVFRVTAEIEELKNGRKSKLIVELRATQAAIDEASRKLETSRRLLFDTASSRTDLVSSLQFPKLAPKFTILRTRHGRIEELAVSETAHVHPGDTIKVEFAAREALISDLREGSMRQGAVGPASFETSAP